MQLAYALKHPESRTVLRLVRRYGSYMRLLIVLSKGRLTKDTLKQPRLVRLLLAQGAKVNAKDNPGRTPLHWASVKGRTDVCGILLTHGAQVNIKDKNGWTPLHLATYVGNVKVCEILLAYGVDAKGDIDGWIPLRWASYNGRADICDLFRAHGAI